MRSTQSAASKYLERSKESTAGPVLQRNGLNPSLVNLNGNGSLQECYRQQETLVPSNTQQDSLYATKGTMLNSHPIPNAQGWPGSGG
ncbi:MAG: hypothetical protein JWO71_2423 [Candidatus Acidoferrum typicum]|nr:hypothetical protein [Candidatus Acidoferrum typicum]